MPGWFTIMWLGLGNLDLAWPVEVNRTRMVSLVGTRIFLRTALPSVD